MILSYDTYLETVEQKQEQTDKLSKLEENMKEMQESNQLMIQYLRAKGEFQKN